MKTHTLLISTIAALSIGSMLAADSNRFEDPLDINTGEWAFLTAPPWTQTLHETECGGPSPYLRADANDNWTVFIASLANDSPFNGNLRAADVTSFGLDLRLNWLGGANLPRELTLMIAYDDKDNQYPGAEYIAYYIGENVPFPAEGWKSFSYDLPANADDTPPGWVITNLHDDSNPVEVTWPQLMENVQYMQLMFGRPDWFYSFTVWDVSIATPWIESGTCEMSDLNCDGAVNVSDLLLLLGNWGVCADESNCLGDLNGDGTVNVSDLLLLLSNWS